MREILFRGKRVSDGEWVEGYYFAKPILEKHFIQLGEEQWMVKPTTIGQYTGLTDKNGKKIFEGDMLNGFEYPFLKGNAHNYFAEVVWFENSPAFGLMTHKNPLSAVNGISSGNTEYAEDFDPTNWEVIGNIYDNPELLED